MCLYACKGSDDGLNLSKENMFNDTKINISIYSDREIEILSDRYAKIFEGMYNALLKEKKRISNLGAKTPSEDYLEQYATSYINSLVREEQALLSYMFSSPSVLTRKESIIFKSYVSSIEPLIFEEDENKLLDEVNAFYDSSSFEASDLASRQEMKLRLESLKKVRYVIINGINEFVRDNNHISRISPGDRMIWSQSMSIMNEKQLHAILGMTLMGMGYIATGTGATIIKIATTINLIWSVFS